ncbi:TIGR04283 family arsenosugar biosynthesis glycosyltransferase [Oceaniglobus trochenteri]|uniref:TIGR04283 family arsenosugar biosynthesis glycosyltransferase n=1 Tax=Oceaniglobus trochenteri TaxID=2763260 RepID=UPI001CFFA85B|nr:TIGR04283 family arsenosugar biosynthesis glycosyltransferase [Oceaniglobus trochenteri]
MPAPLTIVIPTLNAAESLPGCAAALMPGLQAGLIRRLVVSDGGSQDGTTRMAESMGAQLVQGPAGRGAQIARGVAAADSPWVLILHADSWPGDGWVGAVETHLARHGDSAGWFRLAFRATGAAPRFVAGWANLRSRLFSLPYGDQGLLISRELLAQVGGVPDLPLMEDVALARALRGHLRPLEGVIYTGAGRYLTGGWLRRGARNLWTLARYFAGVSPERLARDYRR